MLLKAMPYFLRHARIIVSCLSKWLHWQHQLRKHFSNQFDSLASSSKAKTSPSGHVSYAKIPLEATQITSYLAHEMPK